MRRCVDSLNAAHPGNNDIGITKSECRITKRARETDSANYWPAFGQAAAT